jgi:hypothetical protein
LSYGTNTNRYAEEVRENIARQKAEAEKRKNDERKREFQERTKRLREAKQAAEEALLKDVDDQEPLAD